MTTAWLWWAALAVQGASPTSGDVSLNEYFQAIERHNPALQAVSHRVASIRAQAEAATALPDPTATVGVYASEVETRVGPQKQRLSLSQALPWRGKRALSGQAANARGDSLAAGGKALALELFAEFKRHYAELYSIGRELAVAERHLELLEKLAGVVDAKYRVGKVDYSAFIRVDVELDRMRDRAQSTRDRARPTVAAMNALLGRETAAPIPFPESLPEPASDWAPEAATTAMRGNNPELVSLDHAARAAALELELARQQRRPDFRVGLDWINTGEAVIPDLPESGRDALVVNLSLNLPIRRKRLAATARDAAERRAAVQADRQARTNDLDARLQQALFDIREANRKITLYRDALIPKAQESFNVTLKSFESDRASFSDVIDADRALVELSLARYRAEADRFKAAARAQSLTGSWPAAKEDTP